MDNNRPHFPGCENRLYTRYAFEAHAEIITLDAELSSRVTNISFGGCRLLTTSVLPAGATITVKIRTPTHSFVATAKVIHSTANDVGVMFDKIGPESLLVLQKLIDAAKSASVAKAQTVLSAKLSS
jgi:PilZ domain